MGRVRVKICGITNAEDARAAVDAGADAIGIVFADSPRKVGLAAARSIVSALPAWVSAVGVFVNSRTDEILNVARQAGLNAVQLHGDETPADVRALADKVKVIRAFRIAETADISAALQYLELCSVDACLIDAKVSGAYGGTGSLAPWNIAAQARSQMWPLILGGGLDPTNVADAIMAVRPFGVEASSGVEREPGRKDHEAIRAFIDAASIHTVQHP